MKLLCPLCGRETGVPEQRSVFACEACHGMVEAVPNGKAFFLRKAVKEEAADPEIDGFLLRAEACNDPKKKRKLLEEALALRPDSLAVKTELLHMGRLGTKEAGELGYHAIKCYLLHIFQEPDAETEQDREAMLRELT